jgi:hypothetical protein
MWIMPEASMNSIRRTISAALACFALALLAAPSAGAAPAWLAPVNLSETGSPSDPQIAVDGRGDAVAVWDRSSGSSHEIQAATRLAGGAWQTPVKLFEAPRAGFPAIAIDPQGEAVVAWTSGSVEAHQAVDAAVGTAIGGGWSAPVQVGESGDDGDEPQVAIDPQGNSVVVWAAHPESSGSSFIQATSRQVGGAWSAPADISEGNVAMLPGVAFDAQGNAVAIWEGFDYIGSAELPAAADKWQAPVEIAQTDLGPGGRPGGPQLAADPQGEVLAVWSNASGSGENHIVYSARRPIGGGWQPPAALSDRGMNAAAPHVALDPQGNAIAVWSAAGSSGDAVTQSAVRPIGGAWQAPLDISETGLQASNQLEPHVAVGPQGNAVVAFEGIDGGQQVIQAAVGSTGGGSWQAPVDLSTSGPGQSSTATDPQLAVDSQGNVVAVWEVQQDFGNTMVQAAGYDAAGPALNDLSIPPSGVVGRPVPFSASPLDVWSALGNTDWLFGDGVGASGTSVTHTYSAPGIYAVVLTGADVLGNTTSASGTITIRSALPTSSSPPIVTVATQSHRIWREGSQLASLARKKPSLGTTFSFALNEQASISFAFTQRVAGRRVGNKCVHDPRENRKKPSCRRSLTQGTLSFAGHNGANKVSFQGRLSRSKKLKPGRYTLVITATNAAGQRSQPKSLSFTIVK